MIKAKVLELTNTGHIASQVYLKLNLVQEEQEVVKDLILVKCNGELLQLRVKKFDQATTIEQPLFTKGLKNDEIDYVCFETANQST